MIFCNNNNSHKHNDYFFFVAVIVIKFSHKSELVILTDQMTAFFLNTPITRIIIYIQIIVFFVITMYCSWVIIASCYLFSTAQLLLARFLLSLHYPAHGLNLELLYHQIHDSTLSSTRLLLFCTRWDDPKYGHIWHNLFLLIFNLCGSEKCVLILLIILDIFMNTHTRDDCCWGSSESKSS